MKVYISVDEHWPVYSIIDEDNQVFPYYEDDPKVIMVDRQTVDRWNKKIEEYDLVQQEIALMLEKKGVP